MKQPKLNIKKTTIKSLKNLTVKTKIKAGGSCYTGTCDAGDSNCTMR